MVTAEDLLVAVVLLPTCLRLVKYAGIFFFGQTVMADMISHIIENISAVLIGYMFAGYDLFGKMEDLSKRDDVLYAEPNYIYSPKEDLTDDQWGNPISSSYGMGIEDWGL